MTPTPKLDERQRLLDGIADGTIAPRDIAGLSRTDVEAIARLGASALVGQRVDVARRVFDACAALEPDRPLHLLHLAIACRAGKDDAAALAALARFIEAEAPIAHDDLARALLLRIEICAKHDRKQAESDLVAVKILAERSPAARAVVEGRA